MALCADVFADLCAGVYYLNSGVVRPAILEEGDMSVEVTGLKELERKLKDIGDRAQKLQGTTNVPLSELLTVEFLKTCSRFNSLTEMFNASGYVITNADDFKAVPDDQWDKFIKQNTSFADWNELLGAAAKDWTKDQLGL
jgi:hypothetical protein